MAVVPLSPECAALLQESIVLRGTRVDSATLLMSAALVDAGLCAAREDRDGFTEIIATKAGFLHAVEHGLVCWVPEIGQLAKVVGA